MSWWVDTLRILVRDVLRSSRPGSEVKIQVRDSDGIWRDHSFVSGNSESVQGRLRATGSATGQQVRAVDHSGRMVDFQWGSGLPLAATLRRHPEKLRRIDTQNIHELPNDLDADLR